MPVLHTEPIEALSLIRAVLGQVEPLIAAANVSTFDLSYRRQFGLVEVEVTTDTGLSCTLQIATK